jgi:hypothetical protein|tara:strand:+ start:1465 stop:1686 length:222 start_codon:yes stop_codon:yes gene_type:complete
MWEKIKTIKPISRKANWLGWFCTVHICSTIFVLIALLAIGVNPTLVVSVVAAPLWLAVAFTSKYITDKIMEDK